MDTIKMVDLKRQYNRIKDEIDKAIFEVIESTEFIYGPAVTTFQKNLENYLKVKYAIPCGNGTDALQVALMSLSLNEGDEVITTPFTFVSTVEVIELLKLKPVFVDIDEATFNISAEAIEAAITPKTKVIIPVHLFGQCAEMEKILSIAEKYNLFIIEDNCQSIGAEYIFSDGKIKKAGTIGDIGCISFFPSKNLGCYGDGGAIITNNDELAQIMKSIVNHGMTIRYHYERVGVNSRLDSIQAAILNVKLKYLDEYIKRRNYAARVYNSFFKDIPQLRIPICASYSTHVFHQYTLIARGFDRNRLIEYLKTKNIPSMIYYPIPLHLQKAYRHLNYKENDFPVAEKMAKSVFSLPMHSELTQEELEYICHTVLEFINNHL